MNKKNQIISQEKGRVIKTAIPFQRELARDWKRNLHSADPEESVNNGGGAARRRSTETLAKINTGHRGRGSQQYTLTLYEADTSLSVVVDEAATAAGAAILAEEQADCREQDDWGVIGSAPSVILHAAERLTLVYRLVFGPGFISHFSGGQGGSDSMIDK